MYHAPANDHLFSKADWFSVEEHQKNAMLEEIDKVEGNRLLNTSVDDLCDYFEKKYSIDVPVLHEDQIVADQREIQIDVSRDRNRYIGDRSRPFLIAGTAVDISIPFAGEADTFVIRPSTFSMNPPRAEIRNNILRLTIQGTKLDATAVRSEIDHTVSDIKTHLDRLRTSAGNMNGQLRKIARDKIEQRRQKLLGDQELVAALGFPMRERAGAPKTYTAPEVRRRITSVMPSASTAPYKPEPILSDADYQHILSVMSNMALVMERSPSAFATMDEESLRSHFLVQLNGHYEGQATGETFNYEGKTDILIRVNGKNIFIAECKYWGGQKKLSDTIDQLLGYTSWRDTKVAIVMFNRQKNFSHVLETIPQVVSSHPNYKREEARPSETSFSYIFAHRDDPNREMTLTFMAFDVPHDT